MGEGWRACFKVVSSHPSSIHYQPKPVQVLYSSQHLIIDKKRKSTKLVTDANRRIFIVVAIGFAEDSIGSREFVAQAQTVVVDDSSGDGRVGGQPESSIGDLRRLQTVDG